MRFGAIPASVTIPNAIAEPTEYMANEGDTKVEITESTATHPGSSSELPSTPMAISLSSCLEKLESLSLGKTTNHQSYQQPDALYDDCSPEQKRVLSLVLQGENVFFSGSAGVGKSFVVHKLRQLLVSSGLIEFQDFFITASTGTNSNSELS